jgi:hypothetical protein
MPIPFTWDRPQGRNRDMDNHSEHSAEPSLTAESHSELTPWCHGLAECLACSHEWAAVWPLGSDALECPKCRSTDSVREAS